MRIVMLNKTGVLQFSGGGQELGETDKHLEKIKKSISCYFI